MEGMMKPNFFVIGAMKCATTSLTHALSQHPDIFVCEPKEPEFFAQDQIYARGMDWYEALFAEAQNKSAIGEGSTSYTKKLAFPKAPERIAAALPDARLIYIVRHPIKRIESHWLHSVRAGYDVPPFAEALHKLPNYVDTSLYWRQINAYRDQFPDDQILVLFFEDFSKNPQTVFKRCLNFLGVDSSVEISDAEEPQHVSLGSQIDRPSMKMIRKLPFYRQLRNLLPEMPRTVEPLLKRTINQRPVWDEATRRWAIEQIVEDSRSFLKFYGKPEDFWNLQAELETSSNKA